MEGMQQSVAQISSPVPWCCPNTELCQRGLGAADLADQAALGRPDIGPGGGSAEQTCCGSRHREPEDHPAGLRPAVRRRALRWSPVEDYERGPDLDREPHRSGLRGADSDGESAAGRRGELYPDWEASAG